MTRIGERARVYSRDVRRAFAPSHRGGSGPPLVCLHGFAETWRTWELVLPALERHHDVLAPTLPGHAGGPPLGAEVSHDVMLDALEAAMDDAGFATAHLAGTSVGAYLALRLAERGRARSVVAFAPPGGWPEGDATILETLDRQEAMVAQMRAAAPNAPALLASAAGRRSATALITTNVEHIPPDLLAHLMLGIARCTGAPRMIEAARRDGYPLDPAAIACPVRVVWGTADRLLPWPRTAERHRRELLPHADWVVLDGIGHSPQLDVPVEAAQLILGFTGGA